MEDFSCRGYWGLPGTSPEHWLSGTLEFSAKSGSKLETVGLIRPLETIGQAEHFPIILGIAVDGTRITLANSFATNQTLHMPGIPTSVVTSKLLIIGEHFMSYEELRFSKFRVSFDRLAEWARLPAFSMEHQKDEKGIMKELHVHYQFPSTHEVDMQTVGHFSFHPSVQADGDLYTAAEVRQTLSIEIFPWIALPYSECWSTMHKIRTFLTLGIGIPIYPTSFIGVLTDEKVKETERWPGKPQKTVKMCFEETVKETLKKKLIPPEMLFTFAAIHDDFGGLLQNWVAKWDHLAPILDLYFATVYGDHYPNTRFLNLAQAVESYHRRTSKETILSDAEAERVRHRLFALIDDEQIDGDTKAALKQKLGYLHEISLRRRLERLLESFGDLPKKLIDDCDWFIQKVLDTRNYFTHFDERLKARSASGTELHYLSKQLEYLLVLCLLREAGFSAARTSLLVNANNGYNYLSHAIRESRSSNQQPPSKRENDGEE